ncbi:MAG: hypothetical protein A2X81_00345 [Desulfobacterales bacterium GWB2_56_26]|nr:MAG: hypothetical protein A2X81_00345 [Desulfobacterales bacterium GWB2_56_26]
MGGRHISSFLQTTALRRLFERVVQWLALLFLSVWPLLLNGCAHPPADDLHDVALYQTAAPPAVAAIHTPTFLVQVPSQAFNRIGTPSAREVPGKNPEVFIDPEQPAIYYEIQEFRTAKGRYTNLIYRIHFPEVPLDWARINLTAGRNPGLLIIYTLDDRAELLLVTTVHTCGCYLAFLPTEALPTKAYPPDWPVGSQRVYGYTLPSSIGLPRQESDDRIMFTIASEIHRVRDVGITKGDYRETLPRHEMMLLPMHALYALPYKDRTIPFFETEGCKAGYVKDNMKILERLFMSWWAFDLHVGEDKAYSAHDHSDAIFYTSLKFWARSASDMKDFPGFLSYWGWEF